MIYSKEYKQLYEAYFSSVLDWDSCEDNYSKPILKGIMLDLEEQISKINVSYSDILNEILNKEEELLNYNKKEELKMDDAVFKNIFPYSEPREYQKEIIEKTIEAFKTKKIVLLNAPTGIGKSVIGYSIASYFNNSYILTSQKILQDQYVKDFQMTKNGLSTVKGRANYTCNRNGFLSCQNGSCTMSSDKSQCMTCPYLVARNRTFRHKNALLNYSYFFTVLDHFEDSDTPLVRYRDILVLDECHNLENELIGYVGYTLDLDNLKEHKIDIDIDLPTTTLSDYDYLQFLFNDIYGQFSEYLTTNLSNLQNMDEDDKSFVVLTKKCSFVQKMMSQIDVLRKNYEKNEEDFPIVIICKEKSIEYKPLYAKLFVNDYLFNQCDKVFMMSATIISKEQFCKDLGLNLDDVVYIKCPAVFPKENRPFINLSVGKMDYTNKENTKPLILKAVKELLDKHKNERGIIHTVSYDIASYLFDNLQSSRLVLPKGNTREKQIYTFLTSERNDLVLISPSLTEGIDLKGDLSRFSIICKVPYGNLGDKWIKTRLSSDQNWYTENTIKTIIQMCGRSIRTETDYAVTYMLDSCFNYFYSTNKMKFPSWWNESFIKKEDFKLKNVENKPIISNNKKPYIEDSKNLLEELKRDVLNQISN